MTTITKQTKHMGTLVFREVDRRTAKEMIVKNHYSHKWNTPFGQVNIGVFKEERLLGVAVFGFMMNPNSYKSIANIDKNEIIELNRLWIDDELGHNAETIMLGACWKILRADYPHIKLVQSFADGRLGCGTIYKAANFKYYGYHKTLFFHNEADGTALHKVPLENTSSATGFLQRNKDYLDGNLKPFRVKTYRYIYPLQKCEIYLKEQPYPEYDKGEIPVPDYRHSVSLLARLWIMYNANYEHDYADKAFQLAMSYGTTIEEWQGHIARQYQGKYVKLFLEKKEKELETA
ncbi:hypothetical protein [Enterococcus sp. GC40]|uniref:Mom family adenine methylcarbamoylation protein n=1 Tax=Enterococcus sp. GC40 TaxID=3231359 RepID=UPI00349FE5E9